MDIYSSAVDYLLPFPIFHSWQEIRIILQRIASSRPRAWQLPLIACQAVGESAEKAIPACAALACAQISLLLVDDMLDDDPRGEYRRIGNARASNFALAFQAAAVDALVRDGASASVRLDALDSLNGMMLTTAHGQELDVQNPTEEASYWRVVENKSASFFGCAMHLGALLAEAGEDATHNLAQLGRIYGEMSQIHDDLNDTMAVPANADWLQKRKPLPILFALTVEHPQRARFLNLYQNISKESALQEAQEILIRCGAVSYCVDQLLHRYQRAKGILGESSLSDKEPVASLVEEVIAPVYRLFETLGISSEVLIKGEKGSNRA